MADSFWMPDEAASVYARAQAVVSVECHSPLIALQNRDIGAGDWLFEIEETGGGELWSRLDSIARDPAGAKAKVRGIMATVEVRQKRMVDAVRAACVTRAGQAGENGAF